MPLNLSFTHIMVVLIVALIVLGPDKLPEAARSIARVIRDVRRVSAGLKSEVRETFGDFAEPFSDLVNAVAGGVADATSAPTPPLATPSEPTPALEALPSLGPTAGPFAPGPPSATPAAASPKPAGHPTRPAAGTFMARPGSESIEGAPVIPSLGGASGAPVESASGGPSPDPSSEPLDVPSSEPLGVPSSGSRAGAETTG